MKIIYSLLGLMVLLASCQDQKTRPVKTSRNVVLYFDHYDPQPYKTPNGVFSMVLPAFSYVDSINCLRNYIPASDYDTLVIYSPDSIQEVALNYRHWERVYYPLRQGDTITVTMDSLGYPLLKSKNHPEYTEAYNIPYKLRQGRTHVGLESNTCLGGHFVNIANNVDYIRAQKWDNLLKDYCPIDSLQGIFTRYKTAYMDTINLYKQRKLISDKMYSRYEYYLQLKEYESKRIIVEDSNYYQPMESGIVDQNVPYISYREYLDYYLSYYNKKIKMIIEPQSRFKDWRQTFDELSRKPFQPLSKQLLLERCLKEIGEYFSADYLHAYLNKYMDLTQDSLLYRQIIEKYNLSADANQLLLQDVHGNKSSFQQLLDKHKGKVIYVDFWASWCMPCREEMTPAAELRKKYAGKDIVFVYLAYNDTEAEWKKALPKEGLSDVETNYFILNPKNSKVLEKIELKLIPRYLLFDRNGNLVEMNAPRPSSKQISVTLNKYNIN